MMPAQSLGNREVAHCLPASLLFRLISAGAWDPALHSSPLARALLLLKPPRPQPLAPPPLDHVDDLFRELLFDGAAADIALGHPP